MREGQAQTVRLSDYRPPEFLIEETSLDFELFEDHAVVTSELRVRRNPASESSNASLVLDGVDLETDSVRLDGTELATDGYTIAADKLTIPDVPDAFTVTSVVRIRPQQNTMLEGLYCSGGMFCTQCEAEGFRRITWYLDRPDVMSVFRVRISADKKKYPVMLSNGNREGGGDSNEGRHWVQWHDPFPKPSYLFALVAGNLACVEDTFTTLSGREVALEIYVDSSDLGKCGHTMMSLKQAMKWDEVTYGREYDLDLFMIVAVDDFNAGAMENKGLNVFNSALSLANPQITTDSEFERIAGVVAHEYFHNWSGNRVTCRDWFQLSLKEGFTVFRDAQFTADHGSAVVGRIDNAIHIRTHQFAEDAGPMSHPVRPESYMEINNFYTLTVYEKGAEVVRMIHTLIGAKAFRQGSDLYFERHDGQAATVEDFVLAMEDASGRDLSQFRRWYAQSGTPIVDVKADYNVDAARLTLTVEQSTPKTAGQSQKQPLHIPLRVGLVGKSGALPVKVDGGEQTNEVVLELTQPKQVFQFDGVEERPVPSLLRGFSAPVKVRWGADRDDLALLMSRDPDGFCRWDAGQSFAIDVLTEHIAKGGATDERLIEAYRALLVEANPDRALLARMLRLPSEGYLVELGSEVDPIRVHESRAALRRTLATELRPELVAAFHACTDVGEWSLDGAAIASRALKNACLSYLSLLDDDEMRGYARAQYDAATNMTDRLAALTAIVHGGWSDAAAVLDDFYGMFESETLAINTWIKVQVSAPVTGVLKTVESIEKHPGYDCHNPNKVRALVVTFGRNSAGFHSGDGSGYRFIADSVLAQDASNPRIAARLATPLTHWKKFAPRYAEPMRAQLERILASGDLSPGTFEIVSKSMS